MRVNHNISSMTALRHLGNTSNATDKNPVSYTHLTLPKTPYV